ncbi:MAG: sulfite exporter TauE/SafE family protein [Bacteroidota bacterium]
MLWPFIIGGLSLGAVSSLHCIGMCGPLAMALPVHHLSKIQKFISLFLYQLGRIITYSTLGLIFGLAGRRIYLAGFQQWFSISMGILILALVILYWVYKNPLQPVFIKKLYARLQSVMIKILRSPKNGSSFLLLGMANGLLPCGMVYVAIAGALTTTEISHSVIFMAMFGAGTLPAMMLISYFSHLISMPVRNTLRKLVPQFIVLMAIILILRGLNLGIPFISPILQNATEKVVSCHT